MKLLFLQFLVLTLTVRSGLILPQSINPLIFSENSNSLVGHSISITFKLPSDSSLTYSNYIGIDLKNAGSAFSQLTSTSYTCSLSDLLGNTIQVKNGINDFAESAIFCQLIERNKSKILLGDVWYKLVITMKEDFEVESWGTIGIFTATSTDKNRIIIDSNKIIGTFYSYPNYKTFESSTLEITKNTAKVTAGTNSNSADGFGLLIYINDTFDTSHTFTVSNSILKQYFFCIRYNTTFLELFTGVSSSAVDATHPSKGALGGSLSVETISDGLVRIIGITEDLVPGRTFVLNLTGWKAKNKAVDQQDLEFLIFYKNANTVYSYNNVDNLMKINRITLIEHKASSPSGVKYISSLLTWPVKFKIQPQISLTDVYVAISYDHNEFQKLFFSTSTCDFTDNYTSHAFKSQPVCHGFNTSDTNGFHFKVSSLSKDTVFEVTVWTHFSQCSSSKNIINDSAGNRFKIQLFSSINNLSNSQALPDSIFLLGYGSVVSEFICLESILGGDGTTERESNLLAVDSELADFSVVNLISKEITDINLYNINSRVDIDVFLFDLRNTDGTTRPTNYDVPATNTEKTASIKVGSTSRVFLFNTATYSDGTYVAISAKNPTVGKNTGTFPNLKILHTTVGLHTNAYLEVSFQKQWFKQGVYKSDNVITSSAPVDLCFVAWNLSATANIEFSYTITNANENTYLTNIITNINGFTSVDALTLNSSLRAYNFLYQGTNTNISSVNLPGNEDTTLSRYFIKSKNLYNSGTNRLLASFPTTNVLETTLDFQYFGLFTNCLKYADNLNGSKNKLFDSFEVLVEIKRSDIMDKPIRMYRLINFLTMGGVFTEVVESNYVQDNATTTYLAAQNSELGLNSICVTRLSKLLYSTATNTDNNTLVVFLFNIRLLETDFTSYDTSYPIPNLVTGVNAYGFSNYPPLQSTDVRVLAEEYKDGNYFSTSPRKQFDFVDHHLLSSIILMNGFSSKKIVGDGTIDYDILIPHYCIEGFAVKDAFPVITTSLLIGNNLKDFEDKGKKYSLKTKTIPANAVIELSLGEFINTNNKTLEAELVPDVVSLSAETVAEKQDCVCKSTGGN